MDVGICETTCTDLALSRPRALRPHSRNLWYPHGGLCLLFDKLYASRKWGKGNQWLGKWGGRAGGVVMVVGGQQRANSFFQSSLCVLATCPTFLWTSNWRRRERRRRRKVTTSNPPQGVVKECFATLCLAALSSSLRYLLPKSLAGRGQGMARLSSPLSPSLARLVTLAPSACARAEYCSESL